MNTIFNMLSNISLFAKLSASIVISDYDYNVIVYHDSYSHGSCVSIAKNTMIDSALAFAALFIFHLFDNEEWISYVDPLYNGHKIIHKYIGKFDSDGFQSNKDYFASKAGTKSIIVEEVSKIDEQSIRSSPEYRDELAGYLREIWIPSYFSLKKNTILYKTFHIDKFQPVMSDFITAQSIIYNEINDIIPITFINLCCSYWKEMYFIETSERFYLTDAFHEV